MEINFLQAAYTSQEFEEELAGALFDRDEEDLDSERISLLIRFAQQRTQTTGTNQ